MKSIAEIQQSELESYAKSALIGKNITPNANNIQKWINDNYGNIAFGSPSCNIFHQKRGEVFNGKQFLDFLKTSFFDTLCLHRALRYDTIEYVDKIIDDGEKFATLNSNINELQLRINRIQEIANKETKTKEQSVVDLTNATENSTALIDIDASSILLPMEPLKSRRILTDMMRKAKSPKITILNIPTKNVMRNSPINGQNFSNCLLDNDKVWMQEIALSGYEGELEVEVTLNVSSEDTKVNRIEVESEVGSDGTVSIFTDSQQFGEKTSLEARKSIFVDESISVKTIQIRFTLASPNYKTEHESIYIIGIAALRLMNVAYKKEAHFTTGMIDIETMSYISGASLSAIDSVPSGTSLDYYVQFCNDYGTSEWISIAPLERKKAQLPQSISTQSSSYFYGSCISVDNEGVPQNTDNYPALYKMRNGLGFYSIGKIQDSDGSIRSVDKSSAKLYRGVGQWLYNGDKLELEQEIRNAYINFALDNGTPHLYLYVTETVTIDSGYASSTGVPSSEDILLRTTHPIDYIDSILPPSNMTENGDKRHAIQFIKRTSNDPQNRLYGGIVALSADDRAYIIPEDASHFLNLHFGSDVNIIPIFAQYNDGTSQYLEITGISQITNDAGEQVTIANIRPRGVGQITESKIIEYWQISIETLTQYVDSIGGTTNTDGISDPRIIKMKPGTLIMQGDTIEVQYRVKVSPDSNVSLVPNTLNLVSDGNVVSNGRYTIDAATGSLSADGAESIGVCYASFVCKRKTTPLHTISAWFFSELKQQIIFGESDITPSYEEGEGIFIDTGKETARIERNTIVDIEPGWHRFSIKGKTINRMTILQGITDSDGSIVIRQGKYFKYHNALQKSLEHIDLTNLYYKSTQANPGGFAIADDGTIVVPFDPQQNAITSDYYNIYKDEAKNGLSNMNPTIEAFNIEYTYIKEDRVTGDLTITPEILAYQNKDIPLKGKHIYDKIAVKVVLKATGKNGLRLTPMVKQIGLNLI